MISTSSTVSRFPIVTFAIIALSALMLPYTASLPFRPAEMFSALAGGGASQFAVSLFSMFSYMFLHASFGHFAGNVFFLFMLAPTLEFSVGHRRFAVYVLLCAFSGAFLQMLLGAHPNMPIVGSSGVVFALVATWLIMAPTAVIFEIPFLGIPVRFFWVALLLFFTQVQGLFGPGLGGGDSTAYFIHAGGAIAGVLLWKFWLAPVTGLAVLSDAADLKDRDGSSDK